MNREEKEKFVKEHVRIRAEQYTDRELDIIVDILRMYLESK